MRSLGWERGRNEEKDTDIQRPECHFVFLVGVRVSTEAKLLLFCGGLFLWPVVYRHGNDGAFSSRLQLPVSAAAQCNDIFAAASTASTLPFDANSSRATTSAPCFRLRFLVNFRAGACMHSTFII